MIQRTVTQSQQTSTTSPLAKGGILQRKCASCGQHTIAGGECTDCAKKKRSLQRKLAIGASNDPLEQEADRVADQVMAASAHSAINIAPSRIQRYAGQATESANTAPASVERVLSSSGRPLDPSLQQEMGQRFGYDFSQVRVHTGTEAERSARDINANAYTVGHNIVFGAGQFAPDKRQGQRLIAHELTHVVQQTEGFNSLIQRNCSDPDFCTPYATPTEAADAEWWIRNVYLPTDGATFGAEARSLYESYLSRSPGDSLAPIVFDNDSSYLVSSFKESGDTTDDMDQVIDLVGSRLSRAPGSLQDYTPTMMSLSNFLSVAEMDNRPINYSNPFSVAGHIAGGIGSSDAGNDYRKIVYANVTLEKIPIIGSTGYVLVELTPRYEVFDAIDFCPGDCGSSAEQAITIPMSRLEAGGAAYDVPFKVIFTPESRSKRFWY
ncbi:MAG TPA: DUF4157 domain-containing protein [Trichocoleus sp.]|jgi:hypothetical protein